MYLLAISVIATIGPNRLHFSQAMQFLLQLHGFPGYREVLYVVQAQHGALLSCIHRLLCPDGSVICQACKHVMRCANS